MKESTMEFHECAEIFPLDDQSLPELARDIKKHGLLTEIETFDGKIIDGRRRFLACKDAGVKPRFKSVSPGDPVAYVLSLNLHRRHLSPSQASMVGGRAREMYERQANERQKEAGKTYGRGKVPANLPEANNGDTRDIVGKVVGVSGKLIDNATKVLAKGEPEVIQAVDSGRLSVSSAAKIVDESPSIQKEIAVNAVFFGGRYRKPEIKQQETESNGKMKGVGVLRANDAINCLIRIPKNDALRNRGFQIVTDWIKANR